MTSQTYHFSITERKQENSCRPFRRTLTGSLQLTRERVEV
ncbi:unnamed protein product [Brassica napus]|uniref:(rape) hypothetical protein n=1 Tax=Brassica napus TaxID=3708 RepID=A0A816JJW0_BRANA|nr:unnamed protein product [Brassica napus]